jgi:hypothetical protein
LADIRGIGIVGMTFAQIQMISGHPDRSTAATPMNCQRASKGIECP